jgi:hypothetical protein
MAIPVSPSSDPWRQERLLTTQPCAKGIHSAAAPTKPAAPVAEAPTASSTSNGVETYGSAPVPSSETATTTHAAAPAPVAAAPALAPAQPVAEEDDDLSVQVGEGTSCKRLGCGVRYESENVSRGEGEKAVCRYHPQAVSCSSALLVVPIRGRRTGLKWGPCNPDSSTFSTASSR